MRKHVDKDELLAVLYTYDPLEEELSLTDIEAKYLVGLVQADINKDKVS